MIQLKRNSKGFTLIEVVVVMAVIAVLAILIIGAINIAKNTATETINRANMRTMQTCLEAYWAKNKVWCDGNSPNSCKYEPNTGWSIDNVAEAMTAKGVPCTLAKTSTTAGLNWCITNGIGCSGWFEYIEPNRYKMHTWNFDGSKDIDTFQSP